MGFLDTVAETARRIATGDDWYVKNLGYVIEIQAFGLAAIELGLPLVFIVLPLAPENYRVTRPMRQSVTPTLGGLVAEERGLLWREIEVSGTFGLKAKAGIDVSIRPDAPPGGAFLLAAAGLSGPGWTRRLIYNYFEKYAELKANPEFAADVTMIWHDFKTDEHWVVVPESIEIARTPQRRFQYPYTMRFKAISEAANLIYVPNVAAALAGLGTDIKAAVSKVNQGLALMNSAIQEGSAVLGEVRYFAAGIDSVLDKMTNITQSATDFVNGLTETINIGRIFVNSTSALLQAQLDLMEAADSLPDSVRQNYQTSADGLDAIGAQLAAYGTTYQDEATAVSRSESGAARTARTARDDAEDAGPPQTAAEMDSVAVRSTDNDLLSAGATESGRTFSKYTGFRTYAITAVDSLQSIAARFMQDGAKWYDIAIVNDLKPPYISRTGAPSTVKPGDVISIPIIGGTGHNAVVSGKGDDPGVDLLGTDIGNLETAGSIPGRPMVDIAIDKRTFKDVQTISGIDNYAQALQLRMWTEQRTMPLIPEYGLPRAIGVNVAGTGREQLFELSLRRTVSSDPRTRQIAGVRLTVENDQLDVDMDVIPIGFDNAQSVSTSVG